MKNLLLPTQFKALGWIFLILGLAAGTAALFADLPVIPDIAQTAINDSAVICIALGALFIITARERREDEMTRAVRLKSLLQSLYVYVGLLTIGTLLINGLNFLVFLFFDSILFPCVFVLVFQIQMRRYYVENNEEE